MPTSDLLAEHLIVAGQRRMLHASMSLSMLLMFSICVSDVVSSKPKVGSCSREVTLTVTDFGSHESVKQK